MGTLGHHLAETPRTADDDLESLRRLVAAKERRIKALERSYSYRFGHALALALTAPIRAGRGIAVFLSKASWYLRNRWRSRPRRHSAVNQVQAARRARGPTATGPAPRIAPRRAARSRRPAAGHGHGAASPTSAWVPGNRWDELSPPELGAWTPRCTVSVILPHYRAQRELEITLAALGRQTYPRYLTQVIVADDGSPEPPAVPASFDGLEVSVVTQPRRGFGLARARNTGAAAASGEILVFLDCDMVPEPSWLEAHARWHHLVADAVTVGFRRHVDFTGIAPSDVAAAAAAGALTPLFEGRAQQHPEWIEVHLQRWREMTSSHDDLFRVACGGNLGVRAETFHAVGGCDESFDQWGAEDIELGYRFFTHGALFVPERRALCWHQGLNDEGAGEPDSAEQRSLEEQRAKIAHLIAQRTFRRQRPGRSYRVPFAVVRIDAGREPRERVLETVESLLASRFHDLVVCLTVAAAHPDAVWLTRQFSGDARVRVGPSLDDLALFPVAAVRVDVAPWAVLSPTTLTKLLERLGKERLGSLRVGGPASPVPVRVTTTRALRRAGRLVRDPEDVELVVAELFGEEETSARDAEIQLRAGTAEPRRDPPAGGPFDVRRINPIGFTRHTDDRLAAVASHRLAPEWRDEEGVLEELAAGSPIDVFELRPPAEAASARGQARKRLAALRRRLAARLQRRGGPRRMGGAAAPETLVSELRSYRAVVDPPSLHRDEQRRADLLAVLAAAGVPVWAPSLSPRVRELLGEPLAAALDAVTPEALGDPDERERASVRLRRAGLVVGRESTPAVSVLLAIHRPDYLDHALRQVARQDYEPLELVLALHGDGFPADVEARVAERMRCDLRIVRVAAEKSLGAVLAAAAAAASGELLTKMDSDDWYGAEHLRDLALALEYSGAALVGKGAEFVYLEGRDTTLRRYVVGAETANLTLGGGALMIHRADLAAAGGWRDVPRGVDQGLIHDVLARGGSVFRTHGFGYLLNRHGSGHTWDEEDEYFLRHAAARRPGLDLAFAGIEDDAGSPTTAVAESATST